MRHCLSRLASAAVASSITLITACGSSPAGGEGSTAVAHNRAPQAPDKTPAPPRPIDHAAAIEAFQSADWVRAATEQLVAMGAAVSKASAAVLRGECGSAGCVREYLVISQIVDRRRNYNGLRVMAAVVTVRATGPADTVRRIEDAVRLQFQSSVFEASRSGQIRTASSTNEPTLLRDTPIEIFRSAKWVQAALAEKTVQGATIGTPGAVVISGGSGAAGVSMQHLVTVALHTVPESSAGPTVLAAVVTQMLGQSSGVMEVPESILQQLLTVVPSGAK